MHVILKVNQFLKIWWEGFTWCLFLYPFSLFFICFCYFVILPSFFLIWHSIILFSSNQTGVAHLSRIAATITFLIILTPSMFQNALFFVLFIQELQDNGIILPECFEVLSTIFSSMFLNDWVFIFRFTKILDENLFILVTVILVFFWQFIKIESLKEKCFVIYGLSRNVALVKYVLILSAG